MVLAILWVQVPNITSGVGAPTPWRPTAFVMRNPPSVVPVNRAAGGRLIPYASIIGICITAPATVKTDGKGSERP